VTEKERRSHSIEMRRRNKLIEKLVEAMKPLHLGLDCTLDDSETLPELLDYICFGELSDEQTADLLLDVALEAGMVRTFRLLAKGFIRHSGNLDAAVFGEDLPAEQKRLKRCAQIAMEASRVAAEAAMKGEI